MRPLRGERETEAYAALHRVALECGAMTGAWRARTLRAPQYDPDLDIVIAAPDGALVAFCVGWLSPERRIAQLEPVGTHPEHARHGLVRILLLDMLHRFKRRGAVLAWVETNVERSPARRPYESVGFRQTHLVRRAETWADGSALASQTEV